MIKSLTLLGSTGSIGTQTLAVCEAFDISVRGLVAGSDVAGLFAQIKKFKPMAAALDDVGAAAELAQRVKAAGIKTEILSGRAGICDLARDTDAEMVMCAMVGMAGLAPTVAALEGDHEIALANKETLVAGGDYVMALAEQKGRLIRPVDSEHSAIWQCLATGGESRLERIWLTASGGPFRGYQRDDLVAVDVTATLNHPTWSMGPKITVDSATLMNKGLELIEACHLFSVDEEKVKIIIHPQSIIHSMVEWVDGSVVAQIGAPDMALPIQLALTW
ncbi:MAG TPA: 1-deoxy-D-xylulose-5-phosphate reductoisomerase, partial [Clostridiaceae bacterium]|nr:1-deoxy-D-xylulose-5-phosphate reductoisomerase [Clostridiaceae bacterium]